MKTVAFIPLKLNNERLPGKNLNAFENGKPLLNYILDTAINVDAIDEIYCYCSDSSVVDYLPKEVNDLIRLVKLDQSTTSITDVISNFIAAVDADIYVLIHATALFISVKNIAVGIQAVKSEYDSAHSVRNIQPPGGYFFLVDTLPHLLERKVA